MPCIYTARLQCGRIRNLLLSDQCTCFQLWIFQRNEFHRALQWHNDSCDRIMGCLAHRRCTISRLFTILTDTWPPKFISSGIQAEVLVVKRFLLALPAIRLSSLCVVLRGLPDRGPSSTIPFACKRFIRPSVTEWCIPICPVTFLLLKLACDRPTACHLFAKVNFYLTILDTKNSTTSTCKHTAYSSITPIICKPVLIKHDWLVYGV